jgi:hypothetical protein
MNKRNKELSWTLSQDTQNFRMTLQGAKVLLLQTHKTTIKRKQSMYLRIRK